MAAILTSEKLSPSGADKQKTNDSCWVILLVVTGCRAFVLTLGLALSFSPGLSRQTDPATTTAPSAPSTLGLTWHGISSRDATGQQTTPTAPNITFTLRRSGTSQHSDNGKGDKPETYEIDASGTMGYELEATCDDQSISIAFDSRDPQDSTAICRLLLPVTYADESGITITVGKDNLRLGTFSKPDVKLVGQDPQPLSLEFDSASVSGGPPSDQSQALEITNGELRPASLKARNNSHLELKTVTWSCIDPTQCVATKGSPNNFDLGPNDENLVPLNLGVSIGSVLQQTLGAKYLQFQATCAVTDEIGIVRNVVVKSPRQPVEYELQPTIGVCILASLVGSVLGLIAKALSRALRGRPITGKRLLFMLGLASIISLVFALVLFVTNIDVKIFGNLIDVNSKYPLLLIVLGVVTGFNSEKVIKKFLTVPDAT
jgi:hypothetical protein